MVATLATTVPRSAQTATTSASADGDALVDAECALSADMSGTLIDFCDCRLGTSVRGPSELCNRRLKVRSFGQAGHVASSMESTQESATSSSTAEDWTRPPDFSRLNTYGWAYDSTYTPDENFLDLAMLVARNSTAKDGHMGCALVRGVPTGGGGADAVSSDDAASRGEVVLCTINSALFGAHRSDCHAEANAVSECAARGIAARGLSCYVTRSPCVACYKLLVSAGVCRIVAPNPLDSADCAASAAALGIECVALRDSDSRAARRQTLAQSNEDMDRVRALREERKRLRKTKGFGKKSIQRSAQGSAARGEGAGDLDEGGEHGGEDGGEEGGEMELEASR